MEELSKSLPVEPEPYCLKLRPSRRMIRIISALVIMTIFLLTMAFADDPATGAATNIEGGIKTGSHQLYNIMTAVVLPISAVFFAWNAFKALFGGEKGMEQAKKNMLIIVVVLALVYLAPMVVTQIGNWFSPSSNWNF